MKVGEHIEGASLRVGLTSPPQIDTRGIEVRLVSREILIEAREKGRRRKEGSFKMIPVSRGSHSKWVVP